ncbi:NADPH:quinone oxidoreductase family protein [Yinghuangia soli]|uniref:NADPH:quinone oxidoreductase family protein n=1 Tax=Yinghuangia soli TaxID=2908204 RepID=A0AA41U5G6_9ACTN|nr:NADPH:quinone oxidoreductase family protein [Yinghuangia soli]MCF2533940.1 NADPH:quinone oxidoreductase family protein [Yinghuangia soli]
MRALRCEETTVRDESGGLDGPNGPDRSDGLAGLAVREVADPVPGAGQVLVEVKAASVDFVDTLIAAGRYQIRVPPPFTPGNNLAGVVREVGPDCTRFAVGDRVHGLAFVGAFAELAVVREQQLRATPDDLPFEYACLAGVPYRTAYDALVGTAALRAGENLVVLGASGAVGSAAVAIGKALGARVIACGSSPAKLEFCRKMGADEVVSYAEPGFKEALKAVTGGGADVVLDMVGGEYSEPALRATGYGGRFVVVGFAAGSVPRIPLNLVLLKGSIIRGYEFGDFERRHPEEAAANRDALERMLADGRIVPPITGRYPLEQAAEAMRTVAGRDKYGVTILQMP